jgi:hypothetical protein
MDFDLTSAIRDSSIVCVLCVCVCAVIASAICLCFVLVEFVRCQGAQSLVGKLNTTILIAAAGFVVKSTVTIRANQSVSLTGTAAGFLAPITCNVQGMMPCFFLEGGSSLNLANLVVKNGPNAPFRVEAALGSPSTFIVSGGGIGDILRLTNMSDVVFTNIGFAANATISVDAFEAVTITNLTTRDRQSVIGSICPTASADRTGGLIFTNGGKVRIVSSSLRDLCARQRSTSVRVEALMNFTNVDNVEFSDSVVERLTDAAAVVCNNCIDLAIRNATFKTVAQEYNGVVTFVARPGAISSKINVTDSRFEGNRLRAVVLDVSRAATVNVERTHFRDNVATINHAVAAWIADDGSADMSVTFKDCSFVGSTSAMNVADVLRFGESAMRGRIGSVTLTNLQFVNNSAPTLVRFEGPLESVVLDSLFARGNNITENLVRIQDALANLTAQSWCVCAREPVPDVDLLCSAAAPRVTVEGVRNSCGPFTTGITAICTSAFCTEMTSTSTGVTTGTVASTPSTTSFTTGTSGGTSTSSVNLVTTTTAGSTTASTSGAASTSIVVAASTGGLADDGTGVIIGASVGGAIAAVLLVGGVLFFVCRSRKSAAAPVSKDKPAAAELKPQSQSSPYAAIVIPPANYEQGRFDAPAQSQSNYAVITAKSNDYEHGNVH